MAEKTTSLDGFINGVYEPTNNCFSLIFAVKPDNQPERQISVDYSYPDEQQEAFLALYARIHPVIREPDYGVLSASLMIEGELEEDKNSYVGVGGWRGICLG